MYTKLNNDVINAPPDWITAKYYYEVTEYNFMETKFKTIIIDNQESISDLLRSFVDSIQFLEYIGTFDSLAKASKAIQESIPALVLMDIQAEQTDGLEWLMDQNLQDMDVIIIAGSPEYSIKSYELGVIDYLLKPVSLERFMISAHRFAKKQTNEKSHILNAANDAQTLFQQGNRKILSNESIWLREEKRLIQLKTDDVFYVEGLKDYVKVYLAQEMIVTHLTIGKAESIFLPPNFIRIHRSFIVRKSAIRFIQGNSIFLIDGKELPFGPNYREDIKRKFFPDMSTY